MKMNFSRPLIRIKNYSLETTCCKKNLWMKENSIKSKWLNRPQYGNSDTSKPETKISASKIVEVICFLKCPSHSNLETFDNYTFYSTYLFLDNINFCFLKIIAFDHLRIDFLSWDRLEARGGLNFSLFFSMANTPA